MWGNQLSYLFFIFTIWIPDTLENNDHFTKTITNTLSFVRGDVALKFTKVSFYVRSKDRLSE